MNNIKQKNKKIYNKKVFYEYRRVNSNTILNLIAVGYIDLLLYPIHRRR